MTTPSYMIVETGAGLPNANSYWDVDSVGAYLDTLGYDDWKNYDNDAQAKSIIRSTYYIEKRFKSRYRGLRMTVEQALGWPRIGAFDDDNFSIYGIPNFLIWATAEYAIRAARRIVLAPDPMQTVPSADFTVPPPSAQAPLILGPLRQKIQKVGPIETSYQYDGLSQRSIQDENTTRAAQTNIVNDFFIPEYPEADLWMERLLRNPNSGTRLVRG